MVYHSCFISSHFSSSYPAPPLRTQNELTVPANSRVPLSAVSILILNAIAVLSEDRFLARSTYLLSTLERKTSTPPPSLPHRTLAHPAATINTHGTRKANAKG